MQIADGRADPWVIVNLDHHNEHEQIWRAVCAQRPDVTTERFGPCDPGQFRLITDGSSQVTQIDFPAEVELLATRMNALIDLIEEVNAGVERIDDLLEPYDQQVQAAFSDVVRTRRISIEDPDT